MLFINTYKEVFVDGLYKYYGFVRDKKNKQDVFEF